MLFLTVQGVAAARQIPDPGDAAERCLDGLEFGSRSGARDLNLGPHGPALCVLGMGLLRSHRSVPSEFRSGDANQTYATSFSRFARKL